MGSLEIEGKVDLAFQKFPRTLTDDLCETHSTLFPAETETETRQDKDLELEPDPQPINKSLSSSDEEPSENVPLSKLAKRYRKESGDWSSEDSILLMELSKRIKLRDAFKPETDEHEPSFSDDEHYNSDSTMSVNALNLKTPKIKRRLSAKQCFKQ